MQWGLDELHDFVNHQHMINGNDREVTPEELEAALTKIYRAGKKGHGPEEIPHYKWKPRKERIEGGSVSSNFDVEPQDGEPAPPPVELHTVSLDTITLDGKSVNFDGENVDYKTFQAYMKHFFNASGNEKTLTAMQRRRANEKKILEKELNDRREKKWAAKYMVSEKDSPVVKEHMTEKQKLFWNTTFTRKGMYSHFGSEPRSKVLRGISKKGKTDDGYLMCAYASDGWHHKDVTLDAVNPRPQIARGFGVLSGTPGPGEYEKVSTGFDNSSRFKSDGCPTVKGRVEPPKKMQLGKTPRNLLSFATPQEDSRTRLKKRIRQHHREMKTKEASDGPSNTTTSSSSSSGGEDSTMIQLDTFVAKIKRMSDDKVRKMLDDLNAVPGPNAYRDALTPFLNDKMAVGYSRGPTMAQMHGLSRGPRKFIDLARPSDGPIESKPAPPGPGTYDLAGKLDSPAPKINPVPCLNSPSKLQSHVGPGSYDVIGGLQQTSPLHKNRVALSLQRADFGGTISKPFENEPGH
jgi:hypothetical protein